MFPKYFIVKFIINKLKSQYFSCYLFFLKTKHIWRLLFSRWVPLGNHGWQTKENGLIVKMASDTRPTFLLLLLLLNCCNQQSQATGWCDRTVFKLIFTKTFLREDKQPWRHEISPWGWCGALSHPLHGSFEETWGFSQIRSLPGFRGRTSEKE